MVRQRGANNVVIRGRTSYFGITCQAYAAAGEQNPAVPRLRMPALHRGPYRSGEEYDKRVIIVPRQ